MDIVSSARHLGVFAAIVACCTAQPSNAASVEMTLTQALDFAERNAPDLAVAAARARASEVDVIVAAPWVVVDPMLELGAGGRVGAGQDGADVLVGLQQTFEVFGEVGLRRAAAKNTVEAGNADVRRVRVFVQQEVRRQFFTTQVAAAELNNAVAAADFAERLLRTAQTRADAGDAPALTVRLAQTAVSRAAVQVSAAKAAYSAACSALGRVIGHPSDGVCARGDLTTPPQLASVESLAGAVDEHPVVAGILLMLRAARATYELAVREAMPKLTVAGTYAVEGMNVMSSAQTQHIAGAAISFPLPLFHGNDAERARAQARVELLEVELAVARRQLAAQVSNAWTQAVAARERLGLYETTIAPSLDVTTAQLEMAFRLGELGLAEVMVGREQVILARREALAAWQSWYDAAAQLEAALGKELIPANAPGESP